MNIKDVVEVNGFLKNLYVVFVCSVCGSQKKPFYLRKTSLSVRQAGELLEFV